MTAKADNPLREAEHILRQFISRGKDGIRAYEALDRLVAALASEPVAGTVENRGAWVVIRDPGCVPDLKGPFLDSQIADFLREVFKHRQQSFVEVVTVHDSGIDVQDGPEALDVIDGRSAPVARAHRKRLSAPPAPAGREAIQTAAFKLSCHDQFDLAFKIAENVGYVLTPEPAHPDSPHDLSAPPALPPQQHCATPQEVQEACAKVADRLAQREQVSYGIATHDQALSPIGREMALDRIAARWRTAEEIAASVRALIPPATPAPGAADRAAVIEEWQNLDRIIDALEKAGLCKNSSVSAPEDVVANAIRDWLRAISAPANTGETGK